MKFCLIFLSGVFSREIWNLLYRYYYRAAQEIERIWERSDNSVTQESK